MVFQEAEFTIREQEFRNGLYDKDAYNDEVHFQDEQLLRGGEIETKLEQYRQQRYTGHDP